MDLERAKDIVAGINSYCFSTMGLRSAEPDRLKDVTLQQMVAAEALVRAWNNRPTFESEAKTMCFVPDPRLIAAVYTFLHYDPRDRATGEDNVILTAEVGGRYQFLLLGQRDLSELENVDEDE